MPLVNDYMDETRTIVVTTHQVEEVENLLTDVLFIDKGRIVSRCIARRQSQPATPAVAVAADKPGLRARAEKPFHERTHAGQGGALLRAAPTSRGFAALGEGARP